jgi:biotin synthase
MGDAVHLRGIVEFSNICTNDCLYCGIRAGNDAVRRYRMSEDEVIAVARRMPEWSQHTIVLQSGETVSVGNRRREVYARWRASGMDRYLLRFETSDAELFARLHPDCTLAERLRCLADLRELGVQVGSGFMIGLPGETLETLADNIRLCRTLDLDMIGIGPFISHPATPLAGARNAYADDPEMHFVALATLRICNPDAHIPATTAFDAAFPSGRDLALRRGANVFMPNATPVRYRRDYQLYPDKPCVDEGGGMCAFCVIGRLEQLGRTIGDGPGHSAKRPPAGGPG